MHKLIRVNSWALLIGAAAVAAIFSYSAGFFVAFSKDERKKAFAAFKNKFRVA